MTKSREQFAEALRAFLGDDHFRRFVGQVRELAAEAKTELYWWHVRALDDFDRTQPTPSPRTALALKELVSHAVPMPPLLAAESVPDWIVVEELTGSCPVQGWGVVRLSDVDVALESEQVWRRYFRARWEHWTLTAVTGGLDPVDIPTDPLIGFHHEGLYECGTNQFDAGYMPIDAARFYIVRELARLRSERGAGTSADA